MKTPLTMLSNKFVRCFNYILIAIGVVVAIFTNPIQWGLEPEKVLCWLGVSMGLDWLGSAFCLGMTYQGLANRGYFNLNQRFENLETSQVMQYIDKGFGFILKYLFICFPLGFFASVFFTDIHFLLNIEAHDFPTNWEWFTFNELKTFHLALSLVWLIVFAFNTWNIVNLFGLKPPQYLPLDNE